MWLFVCVRACILDEDMLPGVSMSYVCGCLQVLDEADRLLEDNFGEQLQTIFAVLPKNRQTLLFSATMTETLHELEEIAMNKPFFWQCQDV